MRTRRAKPTTARDAALDMVEAVLVRRRFLDESLEAAAGLEPRDRAFAHALAAMVLRRLGQIDALIAGRLARPLQPRAHVTQNVLRLGVAQLAFLGTPAHAAVSETVALAAARVPAAHKGLVNAVLRRVAEDGGRDAGDAARLNTPDWLWTRWAANFGEDTARAIAEAHLVEAPLDLSVKADASLWTERTGGTLLPNGSVRLAASGRIEDVPGFGAGAWWVQDAAATLPARLLGEVKGRSVADLCAAPGGKTAQLAAAGADVIAVDRSPGRLATLSANLKRLGLAARTATADAAAWRPETHLDAVLLDAPCSATGTIRRHPDLQRVKTEDDVRRAAEAQRRLLGSALAMLKPGGRLVYAVCSLEPEEGPDVVEAWLESGVPARPLPVTSEDSEFARGGYLRTLPSHWVERGGMDGFFAARFERL